MPPVSSSGFPSVRPGAVNLTPNGVYWPSIETSRGVFDFRALDTLVDQAHAHGAQPLLVLGFTPAFASTKPHAPIVAGSVPKMSAWRSYVHAVVARYKTRLDYQIWPEVNASSNWQGSRQQLAQLVVAASTIIHAKAPRALVVSPAMVLRQPHQFHKFARFFATKVGGVSVGRYVDAVGIDAYPLQHGTPEDSAALIGAAHKILVKNKVKAPLWNVEINYGVIGSHLSVRPLPGGRQASYVARTYLLNAASGVKRVYWLAWLPINELGIQMVRSDMVTPPPPARRSR